MLRFEESRTPFYRTITAFLDDKKVGRVDFDLDIMNDKVKLIMVFVEKEYRRKKIATALLKHLQDKYGEIVWNGKTKEGESLYKSFYT